MECVSGVLQARSNGIPIRNPELFYRNLCGILEAHGGVLERSERDFRAYSLRQEGTGNLVYIFPLAAPDNGFAADIRVVDCEKKLVEDMIARLNPFLIHFGVDINGTV